MKTRIPVHMCLVVLISSPIAIGSCTYITSTRAWGKLHLFTLLFAEFGWFVWQVFAPVSDSVKIAKDSGESSSNASAMSPSVTSNGFNLIDEHLTAAVPFKSMC